MGAEELKIEGNKLSVAAFFVLIFVIYFLLNHLTPLLADDYRYSLMSDNTRITSLGQIILSLWEHYFDWGGRIAAHFIAMLFLWIGKPVFNVFNALMLCLLMYLIFMHVTLRKPREKKDIFLLLFIFAASWVSFPMFHSTVVWLTGSANYLWMTVLILMFLLPYRGLIDNKQIIKDSPAKGVLWLLLGLAAGWSNENTGAISLLIVFLIYLYERLFKKTRKFPGWFYPGAIGHLAGFALLILAPGNFVRAVTNFDRPPLFAGYLEARHFVRVFLFRSFGYYDRAIVIVWILILALILFLAVRKGLFKKGPVLALLYIGMGLFCKFIMIASPYFPERSEFGGAVLIIVGAGLLFSCSFQYIGHFRPFRWAVFLLFVPVIISSAIVISQYSSRYKEFNERSLRVQQYKEQGVSDVVLEPLTEIESRYMYVDTLAEDPEDFRCYEFARYHGFRTVRLKPAD